MVVIPAPSCDSSVRDFVGALPVEAAADFSWLRTAIANHIWELEAGCWEFVNVRNAGLPLSQGAAMFVRMPTRDADGVWHVSHDLETLRDSN